MPRLVGPSGSIVGGIAVPAGVSSFCFPFCFDRVVRPTLFCPFGQAFIDGVVPFWTFDRLMEECGAAILRAPLLNALPL